jgi:hypothetical protein
VHSPDWWVNINLYIFSIAELGWEVKSNFCGFVAGAVQLLAARVVGFAWLLLSSATM